MQQQRKLRPKTTAEIAEIIGTGKYLDAAIRRAVREAVRQWDAAHRPSRKKPRR